MGEKSDFEKVIDDHIESLQPKYSNITKEQSDLINSELKKFVYGLSQHKELEGIVMQLAMLNPVGCNDLVTSLFIGGSESDLKLVSDALIKNPTSQ